MKYSNKITVLMPVYNEEKYLEQAIKSILSQTCANFEFLIINDGSNDNTLKILNSYSDKRIKIINNRSNIGITKCLNKGIDIAKGKYIARMDADDISSKERLKFQKNYLDKNKEVGVVCSYVKIIKNNKLFAVWDSSRTAEDYFYIQNFHNRIPHPSVMIRRRILEDVGSYDTKYKTAQDLDLWMRIKNKAQIHQIPKILLTRRIHDNSISLNKKDVQEKNTYIIVGKNLERIIQKDISKNKLKSLITNRVNSYDSLIGTLKFLKEINKKILKDKLIIKELKLQTFLIKKSMQKKTKHILFLNFYRKNIKFKFNKIIAISLNTEFSLARIIFIYLKAKLKFLIDHAK